MDNMVYIQRISPDELIVDNFAGGGGASTGIERALGRPVDIAVNHDPDAIAMHKVNHPRTLHYCESVWEVDPRKATNGRPVALAWFSPDCKHFSKAKGGKPINKEIRGLAWVAVKWAATVRPRVIILENVEEFKTWGPIQNGKPIKELAGKTFNQFTAELRRLGYAVDWRELKACDYGAPTIRKRFFLVARCDGQPITWPTPTHGSGKLPYRTASEIIDWSLPCPSIFDSSEEIYKKYGVRALRPLADATLRRIARGIKKFVIDNPKPFIIPWIVTNTTGSIGQSIIDPVNTITTGGGGGQMLIAPTLIQYHDEKNEKEIRGQSLENALQTVDTSNRYGLIMCFMSKYYSGGHNGCGNDVQEPLNTVTTVDHNAIVAANLVKFQQKSIGQKPGEPTHIVMPGAARFGVVTSNLIKLKDDGVKYETSEKVKAFLVKYYGPAIGQDCSDPLHTITTRHRFALATVNNEQYAITDIGLRMLTPRELFKAQGFPDDYIIDTTADKKPITKTAQVARCGNSVCPPLAEALVRALFNCKEARDAKI